MEPKPTIRHWIEYGALKGVAAVVCLLPYRAALSVGWFLAALAYPFSRKRIARIEKRMKDVFGDTKTNSEIRKLAWLVWRNLFFSGIEMLRAPRHSVEWAQSVTDSSEAHKLTDLMKKEGRVILAVPHMGSWELAGLSLASLDVQLFFIVRKQRNPLFDAYLNKLRSRYGQECLDRDDPSLIRKVLRRTKQGKVLAILPDIRARTDAVHCRFLGGDAVVGPGMALFARQTKTPVLPACVIREGWARHRWKGFDPIYPDPSVEKTDDWQRMMQDVFNIFDREVRAHPEQYFWANKKWILDPVKPAENVTEDSADE
jgi:KDO2-lipid IV(A) lauroyltransferase